MPAVSHNRRQFLALLMAGILGVRVRSGLAADYGEVNILLSGEDEPYRQLVDAIRSGLRGRAVRILAPTASLDDISGLLIPVGLKAARRVASESENHQDPVLAALIPRASYQATLSGVPADSRRRWSAIVLDQPWSRQLDLIRRLLPDARRLGLLISDDGMEDLREIRAAANAQGLVVDVRQVNDERQMFSELRQVLRGVDAMWALPDSRVINRATLEGYLITAYRNRIPVIGYSSAIVDAGALAAVYSSPADVGREVADTVSALLQGRLAALPAVAYPRIFSVKLNHSVARSLELPITDEGILQLQLERGSGA